MVTIQLTSQLLQRQLLQRQLLQRQLLQKGHLQSLLPLKLPHLMSHQHLQSLSWWFHQKIQQQ
jgi:hypothetical protein